MKNPLPLLWRATLSACLCAGCADGSETTPQPQEASPAPVPAFENHIYLTVSTGDTTRGEFIFDTGASDLYIDSLFHARSLAGSLPLGRGMIGGVGKNKQSVRLLLPPLDFTLLGKRYATANVTPLIHLKEIVGKRADGIVGLNFFTGKYLSVDYLAGTFCVSDTLPDTTGYRPVALRNEKGRLLARVRVSIAGKDIEGVFLIDTGNAGTLDLTRAAAQDYGLTEAEIERTTYRNRCGGIGGDALYASCLARQIGIDTFTLEDVGISYSLDESGSLSGKRQYDGLIGNRLLNRFDVIFDLQDMRLFLRPNALYGHPFRNYSHDLLYVDRTDICPGLIVNGMAVGGTAEKAGIMPGDILTAVDSIAVSELPLPQIDGRLSDTTRASVLLSVLRDGQVHEVVYRPVLTL